LAEQLIGWPYRIGRPDDRLLGDVPQGQTPAGAHTVPVNELIQLTFQHVGPIEAFSQNVVSVDAAAVEAVRSRYSHGRYRHHR